MGQVLEIFARNKSGIINKAPIYADEESHYSLANIFIDCEIYVNRILKLSKLEEARKNWLQINADEKLAVLNTSSIFNRYLITQIRRIL